MLDIFEKIKSTLMEDPDEEYDDYDEYDGYLDDEYEEEDEYEVKPRSKKKNKSKNRDVDTYETSSRGNVVSMQNVRKRANGNFEVCMMHPTDTEDATKVVDELLVGKTVVLNLEGIDDVSAQRIFDVCAGAIYALKGTVQSISRFIYIVAPSNVAVSDDSSSYESEKHKYEMPKKRAVGQF
ncbi:MAG: cell division protein SepF [Lachnospiraceae bacterium]|nr:cell division protein SepF [Lachnospiraceae bacterium]